VHAQLQSEKGLSDIVQLREKSLAAFLNAVPDEENSTTFLGIQDYTRGRDSYVVDLGEMLENPGTNTDNRLIGSRQPDFDISYNLKDFSPDLKHADIAAIDLNGDNRSDFIVFTDRDEKTLSGALLLSQ